MEYKEKDVKEQLYPLVITTNKKLKVFISSICGVSKYDKVRHELKQAIEKTQLADVYTFENEGASTLSAYAHYRFALEDSDVCIFLIDNADGIRPGVQAEIDIANKYNIKSLYYFCDETKKGKTLLEQSLMGASFAKSKTVHSFNDLSKDGAQALIDDIIVIYHYYCTGRLTLKPEEDDEFHSIEFPGSGKYHLPTIPKTVLKNVDRCRDYILKFVADYSQVRFPDDPVRTSEFDDWGIQLLRILFEGKPIKQFNISMYLDLIKEQQDAGYHQVVQLRWQAIQAYFVNDIEKCVCDLESALSFAKKTGQPTWVVKDILLDLRNQQLTLSVMKRERIDISAQKELNESNEELYYPILDRINESLNEKYIESMYKMKTGSPYSFTIGNNLGRYGEMLASALIVSMYNGSLTHIMLFYEKVRNFAFYLTSKYDDWSLRFSLFKLAVFSGEEKEIKGIQDSYPEILNNLNAEEAESIMDFCLNQPIKSTRLSRQLLAFGTVGYFLDDRSYTKYEKYITEEIKAWLSSSDPDLFIGENIFKCLSGVACRISQDKLSEICCLFIDRHFIRYYQDIFKFIAKSIDLKKMSNDSAKELIEHINLVLGNENERGQISYYPGFLSVLRKQNRFITDEMDKKVAEYLPSYYEDIYKLETSENESHDMPGFVQDYIERIRHSNEMQGMGGVYSRHGTRDIATVRKILLYKEFVCDPHTMDELISVVADTLLASKESIPIKLDAIALLICIVLKYPEDYRRNQSVYEMLIDQQESIEVDDNPIISSNLDSISLKIGLQLLFTSMGKDVYSTILEMMPYIQGNITTTIAVAYLIVEYLESSDDVLLPSKVESIILQNVLQWLHSEHVDIRLNATRILLMISRNPENSGIVNSQLVNLIDSNNVYIKILIMRNLHKIHGITDGTREYIISKCKHDVNFAVRMVCDESEKDIDKE